MKSILGLLILTIVPVFYSVAQSCSSCGKLGQNGSLGNDAGPAIRISMGSLQYGQSAGYLMFSGALPSAALYTPEYLQFDAPSGNSVSVVTNSDGSLRQVNAPQAIADIPVPPTMNGYVINFYYPSQITGIVSNIYQLSGSPFDTWEITNSAPPGIDQLQVSDSASGSLLKQWSYSYSTNSGAWTAQTLAGIDETVNSTVLSSNIYQTTNVVQYTNGATAEQVVKTYQTFSWGTAPVQIAVGSGSSTEITSYTYYDPVSFVPQYQNPIRTVQLPDGSWKWYAGYDTNGFPTNVYSSFEDITLADATNTVGGGAYQTVSTFDPISVGVSASGDNGTFDYTTPRRVIRYLNGEEISRQYTIFPSLGVRVEIQCTTPGAAWNANGNLVTTNIFYTNGPNQFNLEAVIKPDGTMTSYNYITNGAYQTNITVTGQPDPTDSYIVDGVSNVLVLNSYGYTILDTSFDVLTGDLLSQDVYANLDSLGRPQQVTHLDGSTEYRYYACCGLESTIDRDGVDTAYLYDPDKRQIGYEKFYSGTGNPITFQNNLDAVGHVLQAARIGTDDSLVIMGESAYDTAGELVAQTNALGGVTSYTRSNDPTTGAWIRTTTNPNGGVIVNYYYADGSLKETFGTGTHGKAYAYGYGTDVNGNTCSYTLVTNLNASGGLSSEWTKTFTDMAGRGTETLYADGHYTQSFYNPQGQLSKQTDPDGVATLYQFNAKGELAYTAIDMNQNGTIDFSGSDQITWTTNDVTTDHGATVQRSRAYGWTTSGLNSPSLLSMTETSANGLDFWQTTYRDASTPVTSTTETFYSAPSRTVTNTAPDTSYTVSQYSYGRLVSSTQYDSTGLQIGGTTYGYDAQGRQNTITDARNGTTTYVFNNADLVAAVNAPMSETTTTYYDQMLQATNVVQPDGTSVNSVYLLTGELGLQYGSRTYPVAYSYDYAGRMQTMTNWSNFNDNSGARVTTWTYDPYRGFSISKTYDGDAAGPSYTYTGAGRLATRSWARGTTTTYKYDNSGALTNTLYSDPTPPVTNTYDRLGRLTTVVRNGMTDMMAYNLANQLLSESFSGGPLGNLSVTNNYDSDLRRISLTALSSGSQLFSTAYGYDNASRLSTVSDGNNNSATYSYIANSPLIGQIIFAGNSATRMTTTKQYDYLNRLTQISSIPSATYTLPLTFNYSYNRANQRIKDTLADGSYWVYGYDSLGQVTNGVKYFPNGTPIAGQQFDYAFDAIGNRIQTMEGGDQNGANLRVANYYANNLNQLTNRDVPGDVDVMGGSILPLTNIVTVNGQAAYRNQEYFRQQVAVNNSGSALWTNMTVAGGETVSGNAYVSQEPEHFSYDADGNLTNDGRWAYAWDGENRLIRMAVNTNVGPQYELNFAYDYQGRRIQKSVATNGVGIYTNNFLYDGWNLIATLSPNSQLQSSYIWGSDLSGSQRGAGGIGGLLEVSDYGASPTNCFVAYDGNGNVMALVSAADGTPAANYDYGPFGEAIRVTGKMGTANPFRFSTKYDDDESDLLYYGYRYYKSSTGTWPNRDPLLQIASNQFYVPYYVNSEAVPDVSEYAFLANCPLAAFDYLGEAICSCGHNPLPVPHESRPAINIGGSPIPSMPTANMIPSQSDMGWHTCTTANIGQKIKATMWINCEAAHWFTALCGCESKHCHYQICYECSLGTTPGWRGKPVWTAISDSTVQDCFTPTKKTGP